LREPVAIDLFCGVGGITHGFVRSGVKVVAGIDIDQSCEYAYETNNGAEFICRPIEEVTGEDLRRYYPEDSIKILIGCAPCQPFSMYNSRKRKDGKWDCSIISEGWWRN
jgi:DNA (cytosine-5)-methyltransferase 1